MKPTRILSVKKASREGNRAMLLLQSCKPEKLKKGTAADIPKPLAVFGPKRSHQSVIM